MGSCCKASSLVLNLICRRYSLVSLLQALVKYWREPYSTTSEDFEKQLLLVGDHDRNLLTQHHNSNKS